MSYNSGIMTTTPESTTSVPVLVEKVSQAELERSQSVGTTLPEANVIEAIAQASPVSVSNSQIISIDELSKWTAVILVFVYVAGFLITSLNDFRYGFTEMNPLRPRILAAGGWFTLFLAVPIALAKELMKHQIWKQQTSKWYKLGILAFAYYLSANVFFIIDEYFFAFDGVSNSSELPALPHNFWTILGIVGILLGAFLFIGVARYFLLKLPKPIIGILLSLWMIIVLSPGVYSLVFRHSFQRGATVIWIFGAGLICMYEMRARNWMLKVGDWPATTVSLLGLLAIFATLYYPHIMTKWGGGAPLPIQLTLSKDSPVRAGQTVGCSLIDETDAGFYVIGNNEKHATFIPRNDISIVHFADGNEQSLFNTPVK